jgi:hypothetical protein
MSFDLLAARNRLGIVGGNQDAEIILALDTAIAIVERYLDRKLQYTQEIAKFYNVSTQSLKIDRWPIYSVVSIKGAGGVELTGYKVHHTNGLIEFASSVSAAELQVEYVAGFPTYPPELLLALWGVFDAAWPLVTNTGATATVAAGTIESVSIPDVGTVKFATGAAAAVASSGAGGFGSLIPAQYTALLDRFRNNAPIGVS